MKLMASRVADERHENLRRLSFKGVALIALFFLLVGIWSMRMPIAGAVVSVGQIVVNESVRKVQHPTGGVVGRILVREGDIVEAGQVVVELDQTVPRAQLSAVTKKIDELEATAARLSAERLGYVPLKFPAHLEERRATDPGVAELLSTETALYEARRTSQDLRRQRLQERVGQLEKELTSLRADLSAKGKLAAISGKELNDVQELAERKLVTMQRYNAIQREVVSLAGQREQLGAAMSQSEGKIIEAKMQLVSLDDELRAETTKELRDAQTALSQEQEKKAAALDELRRVHIRAPISGRVHQLTANTVGGVITQAEPIMLVVPTNERLELEVHVQPHDIDQLHVNQEASVRVNAFNRRTTPMLDAKVVRIAADVSKDANTGATYYVVRLAFEPDAVAKLGDLKLQPGMQAEALIKTGERTALEYLTRPLFDQMNRAMRER